MRSVMIDYFLQIEGFNLVLLIDFEALEPVRILVADLVGQRLNC